ncbi:MAG: protein kinase [Planctomycetes bacterium]|nr:protein kinase [Planctomycetota bacterium]
MGVSSEAGAGCEGAAPHAGRKPEGTSVGEADGGPALFPCGSAGVTQPPMPMSHEQPPPAPVSPALAQGSPFASPETPSGAGPQPPGDAPTIRVARPGSTAPAPLPPDSPAPGPAAAPGAPSGGHPFGRYRLLRELGRGGMGVVHLAYDQHLGRSVALKMLLAPVGQAREASERFLREARAVGRLRHPNIVQVHDAGTWQGQDYFTMDFIQGESLEAAKTGMKTRRFVEVLRDVAYALHAAHEAGIVHRDVKPANILLDESGRPFVSDFGLAKEVNDKESRRLTATQAILGTPEFMSPEHANGDQALLGPRSDVWSLGVILYAYLAGRPPFDGVTCLELLLRILHEEPVPPARVVRAERSARRVDPDLETICMKCLEKQPERRYDSARALAEDLGRFLDDEPILARPPSWTYRLRRRLGRRRGLVAAVAAVLLLGGATARFAWHARTESARAESSLLQSSLLAEVRTPLAEAVAASRNGDRTQLEQLSKDILARVDATLAKDPNVAEARHLKGWVLRLLGRLPEAIAELDEAARLRPGDVRTLYERAIARMEQVAALRPRDEERRSPVPGAAGAGGGAGAGAGAAPSGPPEVAVATPAPAPAGQDAGAPAGASAPAAAAGETRGPALAALRGAAQADFSEVLRLARDPAPAAALGNARLACVSGFERLLAGDLDAAERHFTKALEADHQLPDVRTGRLLLLQEKSLRGDLEIDALVAAYDQALAGGAADAANLGECALALNRHAVRLRAQGRLADASRAWGLAEERARKAIESNPKLPEGHIARCLVLAKWAEARMSAGEDVTASVREAIEAAGNGLLLDAGRGDGYRERGIAEMLLGRQQTDRGLDPRDTLRRAIADFDAARQRIPADSTIVVERAAAYRSLGEADSTREVDPRPSYDRALADLDALLEKEPLDRAARANRACVHSAVAQAESAQGVDPLGSFRRAVADFEHVLQETPDDGELLNNVAFVLWNLGQAEFDRSLDPIPSYRRALSALDRALACNPRQPHVRRNQGITRVLLADAEGRGGRDPGALLRLALDDFEAALLQNPGDTDAFAKRALCRRRLADASAARGADPRADLERALVDLDEAVRRMPSSAWYLENRSEVGRLLGELDGDRGRDPRERHRRAIEDASASLRLDAKAHPAYTARAIALLRLGEADGLRGIDPRPSYRGARADLEQALTRAPDDRLARSTQAILGLLVARAEEAQGADPRPSLREAIDALGEFLRRWPADASAYGNRAVALADLAKADRNRGVDPRPTLRRALTDYDQALRWKPDFPSALNGRGNAWREIGDVDHVLRLDPRESLRQAIEAFSEAIRRNPKTGNFLVNRASAYAQLAEVQVERGEDPRETVRLGLVDCDEALRLDAASAPAHNNRGNLLQLLADAEATRGGVPGPIRERALQDFQATIAAHAPQGYLNLGRLLRDLGRYEEAIAAFEACAQAMPELAGRCRLECERTRAAAVGKGK